MHTRRWRIGIAIWGLVVLGYGIVIWPRHFEPSPFMQDEGHLAARIGVVAQFFAIWLFPVALAWVIARPEKT